MIDARGREIVREIENTMELLLKEVAMSIVLVGTLDVREAQCRIDEGKGRLLESLARTRGVLLYGKG